MTSHTLEKAKEFFIEHGIQSNLISNEEIRVYSLLYMVYWFERLKNNNILNIFI